MPLRLPSIAAVLLTCFVRSVIAGDCPFPIPEGTTAVCGTLEVPASRTEPSNRKVSLFYVRVAAAHPDPTATPVLFLNGGPGLASSDALKLEWPLFDNLHQSREIIFLDQRGTGLSLPSLVCPDTGPQTTLHGVVSRPQILACRQRLLKQGYQTGWFDTAESAEDAIALRKALNIPRWNLFGTSYGTVVAQEILRHDNEGVATVVLNSPTLVDSSALDTDAVLAVKAAWERIFLDCASLPACTAAFPDARARFLELAAYLERTPMSARWTNGFTHQTETGQLTLADLNDLANLTAGSGIGAPLALSGYSYLYPMAMGAEPLDPDKAGNIYLPAALWANVSSTAVGLNLSVTCKEVWPRLDVAALRHQGQAGAPYVQTRTLLASYEKACPLWQAGRAADTLYATPQTNVPVLLLTGTYDMLAPSYRAVRLAETLPKSHLVTLHGIGHGVFEASHCGRQIIAAFLNAPDIRPDTGCVALEPNALQQIPDGAPKAK